MTEGPESKGGQEGSERFIEKRRMDELRRFFNPNPEADHPGIPLELAFLPRQYARMLIDLDVGSGKIKIGEMSSEEADEAAQEAAQRYQEDLEWFVKRGLLERVGEGMFRLTEEGKARVRPH